MKNLYLYAFSACLLFNVPLLAEEGGSEYRQSVTVPSECSGTQSLDVNPANLNWFERIFTSLDEKLNRAKGAANKADEEREKADGKLKKCQDAYDDARNSCNEDRDAAVDKCNNELDKQEEKLKKRWRAYESAYRSGCGDPNSRAPSRECAQRRLTLLNQAEATKNNWESVKAQTDRCVLKAADKGTKCEEKAAKSQSGCVKRINDRLGQLDKNKEDSCKEAQQAFLEELTGEDAREDVLESFPGCNTSASAPNIGADWSCYLISRQETGRQIEGEPKVFPDLPESQQIAGCQISDFAVYTVKVRNGDVYECFRDVTITDPFEEEPGDGDDEPIFIPDGLKGLFEEDGSPDVTPTTTATPGPTTGGGGNSCEEGQRSCESRSDCPAGGLITGTTDYQQFECNPSGCCEEVVVKQLRF